MIYTITFNPSLDYIMHVDCFEAVSYTHLDVYKRQAIDYYI